MPNKKPQRLPATEEAQLFVRAKEMFSKPPMITGDFGNQADLNIWVAETDSMETIATVYSLHGIEAKEMSNFIIKAMRFYLKHFETEQ